MQVGFTTVPGEARSSPHCTGWSPYLPLYQSSPRKGLPECFERTSVFVPFTALHWRSGCCIASKMPHAYEPL